MRGTETGLIFAVVLAAVALMLELGYVATHVRQIAYDDIHAADGAR